MIANAVIGGWGGGIFCSYGELVILNSHFKQNWVISSYTFIGQGGAIMVSQYGSLNLTRCIFFNNSALPMMSLSPLSYSGSGGAIFAQSASLAVSDCTFRLNNVITGYYCTHWSSSFIE
jgi:hypothetical protein